MRTYRIILDNGSETGTRAWCAEEAMRQAVAIFGEHIDRIERV
jgi:predicted phosphoribosyltransferase